MYSFFILFIILIVVLYAVSRQKSSNPREYFLSNTIELTDLTLSPIRISLSNATQRDFFQSLMRYIPLTVSKPPQIITAPKSLMINQYQRQSKENLRLVTNLYSVYLTVISEKDSMIYTYDDILTKRPEIQIVGGADLVPLCKTLFPNRQIKQIEQLPKILQRDVVYVFWDTEYSPILNRLSVDNKFIIADFPQKHPVYDIVQFSYPNLFAAKYSVIDQGSINTKKVVYSLKDTISLWTTSEVQERVIYNFIKTLMEHIEDIRSGIRNKYSRKVFEELRPENMIEIDLVPYHKGVVQYFRELQIYTDIADPVCVNTITTIKCNPARLWDNRFRTILYGSD